MCKQKQINTKDQRQRNKDMYIQKDSWQPVLEQTCHILRIPSCWFCRREPMNLRSCSIKLKTTSCWEWHQCSVEFWGTYLRFSHFFGSVPGVSSHWAPDKDLRAGYQFLGHWCFPHLFCVHSQVQPQRGCNPSSASPACADRFAVCEALLSLFWSLFLPGWHALWTSGYGSTSSGCPQESPGRTCKSLKISITLSLMISCSVSLLL